MTRHAPMLPLCLAILAAALAVPRPAAAANACPLHPAGAELSFAVDTGRVVTHTDKDRRDLVRLQVAQGQAIDHGVRPLGFTEGRLEFNLRSRVRAHPLGENWFCAVMAGVEARLGYERLTVHIAKEYPRGSCEHRVIRRHENAHVAVFRDTLRRHAPRIRAGVRQALATLGPVRAATTKHAAELLQAELMERVSPLLRALEREQAARNAALDTTENYRQEQSACGNW